MVCSESEAGFSTLDVVESKEAVGNPTVGGSEPVCSKERLCSVACSPGHRHKDASHNYGSFVLKRLPEPGRTRQYAIKVPLQVSFVNRKGEFSPV